MQEFSRFPSPTLSHAHVKSPREMLQKMKRRAKVGEESFAPPSCEKEIIK
jgi:hypothetical protein